MKFRRGYTDFELSPDRQQSAGRHPMTFSEARQGRDFIALHAGNSADLTTLRAAVNACTRRPSLRLADHGEVLRQAGELLMCNRLRIEAHQRFPATRVVWEPEPPTAAPVKAVAAKTAIAKRTPPRRSRLPVPNDNPLWEPLRKALRMAHAGGVPFCEDCARQALEAAP